MCGLAGVARLGVDPEHGVPDPLDLVPVMTEAVRHRGPESVAWTSNEGNARLGFARLGLVGLGNGSQPLHLDDGSLVLIANGEVYNHRELARDLGGPAMRTDSDCEVLLHLYRAKGLSFLDDVRGMFSLVLWDRRANTLVMAKDPFGIKPLFFHADEHRILFASQVTALFEDPGTPRQVDWQTALTHQLMTGDAFLSDQRPESWFADITMVPAGGILTFDLRDGSMTEERYWDVRDHAGTATGMSADELVVEYRNRLEASVRDCETADVGVGLFLSGGIDSAAIAALSTTSPHTYSALNASTLRNGDFAASIRVASELGLRNDQVVFTAEHIPTADEWLRFVWLMETPLAGPEAYYKYEMYRYVQAVHPSVKAMMLGGGADEFNGGYTAMLSTDGWDGFERTIELLQRRTLERSAGIVGAWDGQAGLLSTRGLASIADAAHDDSYLDFVAWKYRDVQQYNCWHEDRSAAGSGVEARVPFLDRSLVELSVGVPRDMRRDLLWDKTILRRGMRDRLAEDLVDREKIPFFYGSGVKHTYRSFGRMLLADGGRLIEQAMESTGARAHLDVDAVRATAEASALGGEPGQLELVLRLVNLGLLESQLQSLPGHHTAAAHAGAPASFVPSGDDAERAATVALRIPEITATTVGALEESVEILRDDAAHFVVVNGQVEFVVEPDEDPAWTQVLLGFNGVTPLGDLCDPSDLAAVVDTFEMAVDAGVVRIVDRAV